ncbi:MAG TPA: transketolase, partial [Jatrophihabitans sp.]|nr:transketolase [Jatrophihabitans sp.]
HRDPAVLARQLRIDSVRATHAAKAGHPTSAASAADLIAVLAAAHFRADLDEPADSANDRFVLSKGHASVLLYSWLKSAGAITDEELLGYAQLDSRLEGHPRPVLPWVDVATGSLGQGIAAAVGLALSLQKLEHSPARVYVLCGDSEMAEGSVWEAFEHAAHFGLNNLVVLVDVNGLGQRGPTMVGQQTGPYAERARAFGWQALEIDGHDHAQIDAAYRAAAASVERPTVIVAKTEKGRGLGAVEGAEGWHGRPLADAESALEGLGVHPAAVFAPLPAPAMTARVTPQRSAATLPSYELGELIPTRLAYGEALVALGGARGDVVVLDAETSNSTYAELFRDAYPDRYFEMYIAEQQMVAAAAGLAARGWMPFASTFAAFTTRAFELVRMSAIGGAAIRLCGSHAGLTPGESGPSGMALEDLACFRAIAGSVVLQPCDGNQAAQLVQTMADAHGFAYLRTHRSGAPVIYPAGETFPIGGSRVLRSSPDDTVTIVASGTTVHPALAAVPLLRDQGVAARVVDCYSIKPIDADTILAAAADSELIVTAEDHYPEGGLGSAVAEVLAEAGAGTPLRRLAITRIPGSAPVATLMSAHGLDADGIARTVLAARRELVG